MSEIVVVAELTLTEGREEEDWGRWRLCRETHEKDDGCHLYGCTA